MNIVPQRDFSYHLLLLYQANGTWTNSSGIVLDYFDPLDSLNKTIDRHECVVLDVNRDGGDDLVCLVGANKGSGVGYNEIYLTRGRGTLKKVKRHGLQKYKGMRTRVAAKLYNTALKTHLIFVATTGTSRGDRRFNLNRMFLHLESGKQPFFEVFPGPWAQKLFVVNAALVADVNDDGRDE